MSPLPSLSGPFQLSWPGRHPEVLGPGFEARKLRAHLAMMGPSREGCPGRGDDELIGKQARRPLSLRRWIEPRDPLLMNEAAHEFGHRRRLGAALAIGCRDLEQRSVLIEHDAIGISELVR